MLDPIETAALAVTALVSIAYIIAMAKAWDDINEPNQFPPSKGKRPQG